MSNLKPSLSLRALNFLTGSTATDAAVSDADATGSRASMKELVVETSLRDATTTRILKSTVVADSPVSPQHPQDDSALPDPSTKSASSATLSKSKLHASAGTLTTLNDEEGKGAREKELSTSSAKKKPFSSFSSALKGLRRSFEALNRASNDDPLFLLDTRVPDVFESIHLSGSFNVYAPPILQKRWRKNTGTGPAPSSAALAPATHSARPMSAPAPTGRRTSVRGVVLESLVFPESERDRFRDAFLATDQIAVVFDETMAEHGAPGSVVWTVSHELLAQPGRTVYLLEGGFQALVQVDMVVAHLVGPAAAAATAKPDAVASLAVDSAPFQRTSSFSLRTSNLQRPKRMSLSLGPSGAAAAAAPVADVPPPSALPNGGMRRLSTGTVPIALARTSLGDVQGAIVQTTTAIYGHARAAAHDWLH
ncbi:hypothetical protein AMAG_20190 [Allomyces macrogynus ATCC 38327]|uniref:Rhodanese domain-containing protein n=1 Tax=Allomyces macrogynus (strain ATCC 38327) TaxID=578462 RepID=A0A0L0T7S2_ALLM3|nr:hypothetical protein AMAG_20190 [Allomyces macrogynus ATCC 38327]|eukprot:KNE70858.1 hypothetical protein AMAG_20190 [Allomyces macrogynus ATCC 38327]